MRPGDPPDYGFQGLNFEHVTATLTERAGPAGQRSIARVPPGEWAAVWARYGRTQCCHDMGYSTLDGFGDG